MTNSGIEAAIVEMDVAIRHIKTAQAMVNDARLALIRADRKLGPHSLSANLSSHIKQMEGLAKEHSDCATFLEATLISTKGGSADDDVEIVQGR
jgi:hypothetical protein